MFKAFSWGDFALFCLILAVPYYAFVLWKYYREDIRDWFANRGNTPVAPLPSEEDDEAAGDLYTVHTSQPGLASAPQATTVAEAVAQTASSTTTTANVLPQAPQDVSISDGVVVESPEPAGFELRLFPETVSVKERSLAEVIRAANGVDVNAQGALVATNPNDTDAANLAQLVNRQRGLDQVLEGVAFSR